MKSLGIIVYSDGSQAEIIEHEASSQVGDTWTEIVRLKKPRRLTLVPFGLLVGLLWLLSGCVHLQRVGDKPICLLDYKTGIKHCEYDSWQACHDALRDDSMCFRR